MLVCREKLALVCQSSSHSRVLITHGTDSLTDTAVYLAHRALPQHQTIVITGALKPEVFKQSEAEFNVGVAVGALQGGLEPGVYVAMSGTVFRWDHVTRDSHTDLFVAKD